MTAHLVVYRDEVKVAGDTRRRWHGRRQQAAALADPLPGKATAAVNVAVC